MAPLPGQTAAPSPPASGPTTGGWSARRGFVAAENWPQHGPGAPPATKEET